MIVESPYLQHQFDNGARLVAEKIDTVQSVSVGFFFKTGVLYEEPELQGVSHFIEHMLFKGTARRSAKEIAREFDRIGGYLNAFTAKDYCCFYSRVVKDKLETALDVLSDMFMNASFVEDELERERKVILEEIKMYEDSPDEIIHELLGQNLWKNSKLGKPILGTASTVADMTRDAVLEVFRKQYVSGNMMICVAGNFEFSELISLLEKQLVNMRPGSIKIENELPEPSFDASVYTKEIEQVHLTVGGPGVSFTDPDRFPITILNAAFGGGMSSRLFQEIREKRGLAYTVYSYHTSFRNAGLFGIYAGTSIESLKDVLDLFKQEIGLLGEKGLSDEELQDTKDQLKGNMLIALESTTNRMNRLATEFLYGIAPKTPTEAIAPYMAVEHNDVIQIAKKLIQEDRMAITMIAPSMDAADMLEESSFSGRTVLREKLGKSGK